MINDSNKLLSGLQFQNFIPKEYKLTKASFIKQSCLRCHQQTISLLDKSQLLLPVFLLLNLTPQYASFPCPTASEENRTRDLLISRAYGPQIKLCFHPQPAYNQHSSL